MKLKTLFYQILHPKEWRNLFRDNREIILYILFGVGTTLVSFASYYLFRVLFPNAAAAPVWLQFLYRLNGSSNTALPVLLSWLCAVTFAYVTNRLFVFSNKAYGLGGVVVEMLRFFASRIFTLLVEIALMFILVDLPAVENALYEFCAKFFSAVVVTILNYVLSKLIVFRKKGGKS